MASLGKNKKKEQSKTVDTYFYSAKKKKSGEYKFDYKLFAKETLKYTKWTVYLFLLIVSLWGCFQSFVVTTNPQLGKGLEVYMSYDDVYGNNYTVAPTLARETVDPEATATSYWASSPEGVAAGAPEGSNIFGCSIVTDSTSNSWNDIGMGKIQSTSKYYMISGITTGISVASDFYNPNANVDKAMDDDGNGVIDSEEAKITEDSDDPATTTYTPSCGGTPISVSEVITRTQNEIDNFIKDSKIYFVPDQRYSSNSVAPSNIANEAIIDARGDEWSNNAAKSSERIDNAGWALGMVSFQEWHTSEQAQTEFADPNSPTYVTAEEYFMNPYYPESGMYTSSTDGDTSTTVKPSNPYAVSSQLYDLDDTTHEYSYKEDYTTGQSEVAAGIAENGFTVANSNQMNSLISNSYDENSDGVNETGYANGGKADEQIFIGVPVNDNLTDFYEYMFEDTNTGKEYLGKTMYYIPFGGISVADANIYSGVSGSENEAIKTDFDTAFSLFGLGSISQQLNSREIIVSWGDAWEYGPFYGLFVWPISQFALWVGTWITWAALGVWSAIVGVIFIVLMLRLLSTLLSLKSFNESAKTQEIQLKTAEVNAKYSMYDKSNKEMMSKKQQETMAIYKKEGVSPFGAIGTMLLTMPIFLAMWRVISALPAYKIGSIAGVSFGASSLSALMGGAAAALLIMIPVVVIQYVSFKAPTWLAKKRKGVKHIDEKTKEAMKKSNRMSNFMGIFLIIIGLTIPSLLAIYWIVSGLYTIFISLLQHYLLLRKAENIKLERLGTTRKEEIAKGNIVPWYKNVEKGFNSMVNNMTNKKESSKASGITNKN